MCVLGKALENHLQNSNVPVGDEAGKLWVTVASQKLDTIGRHGGENVQEGYRISEASHVVGLDFFAHRAGHGPDGEN